MQIFSCSFPCIFCRGGIYCFIAAAGSGRLRRSTAAAGGTPGSAERRRRLLRALDLPEKLHGAALLDVLGALFTAEELKAAAASLPALQ